MKQEDKDLCQTCEYHWIDFPLHLDRAISHCEKVDEKYGLKCMDEFIPFPCLECPFNSYKTRK